MDFWAVIEITASHTVAWKYSPVSNEHKPDSDVCGMCRDTKIIVLPTCEMYRVCAPEKWKSYECAARQLITLKKPAAHADLPTAAESSQRQ